MGQRQVRPRLSRHGAETDDPEFTSGLAVRDFSNAIEREIMDISRMKDYSRRFRLSGDDSRDGLVKALNVLLAEVQRRDCELQQRLDELVDARDDAQTSNLLLRRVKDDLQARTKELDEACARSNAANTAKSQFLANMSHEIRTPMNGILGMAELLARTSLETRQQKLVSTIVQSGRALLTIINDILDFSKIESGKIDIECRPFDFKLCIEDVMALLGPAAERKHIGLHAEIAPSLPAWYSGDVGRIRQILTNIIGNAVKFTDKGEVKVRLSGEPAGEKVKLRIDVTDSGIGIPPEKLDEVFDKFSQVDNTSTRRHEGTGLGLAISRLLARRMGGDLAAVSTPGQGSTFTFTVDLAPHIPEVKAKKASQSFAGARVLLVGAEDTPLGFIRSELAAMGFEVREKAALENGELMLEPEASASCNAVIIDIASSCPALVQQIATFCNAERAGGTPPVLVIAGLGAPGDANALSGAGVRAFLTRPLAQGALQRAMQTVLADATDAQARLVTRHTIAEERRAQVPTATIEKPAAAPRRILLVEDSKVNQEVAREFLEAIDCEIAIANNGKEAVDALERERYDVVLMDCQMPVMDGFEATRIIREREAAAKTPPTPIIALTANAFASDREKCLASGMSDFLSKPFMPDEFEQIVEKWLDNPSGD